ncbi:RING-H2 finger protein ATL33-like isoform X2 [Mangifera indica]|uniref:RING-H2 finger protein ATL33-like isoform X2 n=1 Tax=Mangifera indica TaxID=29780 RepID=UPI001CF9A63D|nr:RING-H2 finger protein ATL33-like isoform X2 [Mangifera indica]
MASAPTNTFLTEFPNPPPFPASPRSVDFSPLEFILALLAIITIPALIYAFLFSLKCPPRQFRRRRNYLQRSDSTRSTTTTTADDDAVKASETEVVVGVKNEKDTHVTGIGTECPVCLSVLADGDEIKQLSACKHSFHASCIDKWLKSQSNCPICRASVPDKRPNASASSTRDGEDLQQDDLDGPS